MSISIVASGVPEYNSLKMAATSATASKLSQTEQENDINGDGVLSIVEKAAYLKAVAKVEPVASQSADKAGKFTNISKTDTLTISDEAMRLYKEAQEQKAQEQSNLLVS